MQGSIEEAIGSRLDPASFDAAVSSFVIQLIVDRLAALRAIREALRPGGIVALVTWADGSKPVDPEAAWQHAVSKALAEAGTSLPDLPEPPRGKPFESPEAAVAELRAAGFDRIAVERVDLVHDFGRAGGRAQLLDYDHAAEFEALPAAVRVLVVERLDPLLDALPDAAFDWTAPLLRATARRAG